MDLGLVRQDRLISVLSQGLMSVFLFQADVRRENHESSFAEIIKTLPDYFLQFDFRGVDKFREGEIFGSDFVDAEFFHLVDISCHDGFYQIFGVDVERENLVVFPH